MTINEKWLDEHWSDISSDAIQNYADYLKHDAFTEVLEALDGREFPDTEEGEGEAWEAVFGELL